MPKYPWFDNPELAKKREERHKKDRAHIAEIMKEIEAPEIEARKLKQKEYQAKHKEQIRVYAEKYRESNRYELWSKATIKTHKQKGFVIDMSIDELETKAIKSKSCCICGTELAWHDVMGLKHNSPTLDRIDNADVMNMSNTQIICHRCNNVKGSGTFSELIGYCLSVLRQQGYIVEQPKTLVE